MPEWLHLAGADGTLAIDDPPKQTQVLTYIRKHRPDLGIAPLVNNSQLRTHGVGERQACCDAGQSGRARARLSRISCSLSVTMAVLASALILRMSLPAAQPALKTFMHELYAQFHPLGLEVSQSVAAR